MKKRLIIILGIILVLMIIGLYKFVFFGGEDNWIKNETGIYAEYRSPSGEFDQAKEQMEAILCALNLYKEKKDSGMFFNSQCLGTCGKYAVDIVHVPRIEDDNKLENQCEDFITGKVGHFIELDPKGSIFRAE